MKSENSFARTLLWSIATKIGRRQQDMQRFIKILQAEWCDSKQALAALSANDFQRLQIPGGLASLIMEAVGERRPQKQQKMDVESPVQDYLQKLSQRFPQDSFAKVVEILTKIFTNIRENLIDEKYRTLKKSNQKIAQLASIKEIVQILKHGGFQQVSPGFVLKKINISLIDECLDSISKFSPQIKFNPYQSHISSIGDTTVQSYEGDSSVVYNQKLAELQKNRFQMMSKPVKNRQIRVFQIEPNYQAKFDQQFNEEKEFNNEDERIYMQNMKQILKRQGEDPKFTNRRKQEYLDLVKKPCFSETLIRIKLLDNWVFQCKFAPLQTLQTLVSIFRQMLNNKDLDYYLYMTPPVQKLSGVILKKTFYDLGCVPRAIFYFKCEQAIKGHLFKSNNFYNY